VTTRNYSLVFGAGEQKTLPGGVFFLVTAATSAISIVTRGSQATPRRFDSVGAGLSFGPIDASKAWTYLDVTSAGAQTVEIIVSDDAEVRVGNVVSVSGSVATTQLPSSAHATPARIACPIGADTLLIAANGARKRLIIQVPSTELTSVVVGPNGSLGALQGLEIQPGTNEPFVSTAAYYGRGIGGTTNVQIMEET
jgi:hypothetical protein